MASHVANRKRKPTAKEQLDASDVESFPGGSLDSLSSDEEEDRLLHESDKSDSDSVDAFPEIDTDSDSDTEGGDDVDDVDEGSSANDEEFPGSEDEAQDIEGASSENDLHIFPKAKTVVSDITGQPKKVYPEIEPDYDSDSSTEDAPNRIGNIPLHWYDDLPHVGYDIDGTKVLKPARGDELDKFLKTVDDPSAWTSAFDKNTQMDKPLTAEELDIIRRLEALENPDSNYDPYHPTVEWFTGKGKEEIMPLSAAPEPKRRWIPSKWEKQKVMKIVRAIRQGRILPSKPKATSSIPQFYAIWNDEPSSHAPPPLTAPKLRLPTHSESYNPPEEHLPTEKEQKEWEATDKEDRERDYLPQKYSALRLVPAYGQFIQERFSRQLDLYLAPRIQRAKLNIDPNSLIPKLPSPNTLRPFPNYKSLSFPHARGRVRCASISPDGAWVVSADEEGAVCLWEVIVGREVKRWSLNEKVGAVEWCPRMDASFFVVGTEEKLYFFMPPNLPPAIRLATKALLIPSALSSTPATPSLVKWVNFPHEPAPESPHLSVDLPASSGLIRQIAWHRKGDYFATVCGHHPCPTLITTTASGGGQGAVWIHQVSRRHSQAPFKKIKGSVQLVLFHPSRPHFFVATQRYVRIYNLAEQKLLKMLTPGIRWISSMDVHPSGDHLIVGGYDRKLCWFDLELSEKPYKILRYHSRAIRSLHFHPSYPLFVSSSDDGSIQVFHARVYSDLLTDPLIVPLKILRGHDVREGLGVLQVRWVPKQPWLVSTGADSTVAVWCH
ncbi:BOP1NT-domain-containing protein [Multifurca ochricompacta]|uniref:Ribosome biogenesis protein ERB1 n=1 Tax=Multifurca ochricompacta TaxID=376703 RepID=A0AAD4M517_9AGAM|nr:BOP1NT-domain-containing protein [Multifurca ochricompacta]